MFNVIHGAILIEANANRQEFTKELLQQLKVDADNVISANLKITKGQIQNRLFLFDISEYELDGNFDCSALGLTSLEGCPKYVNNNFNCSMNHLTTLQYGPIEEISGNYDCSYNDLITLEYAPPIINGDFICSHNNLITLEGIPKKINGDFYCAFNTTQFTEADVRKVCNVGGYIEV